MLDISGNTAMVFAARQGVVSHSARGKCTILIFFVKLRLCPGKLFFNEFHGSFCIFRTTSPNDKTPAAFLHTGFHNGKTSRILHTEMDTPRIPTPYFGTQFAMALVGGGTVKHTQPICYEALELNEDSFILGYMPFQPLSIPSFIQCCINDLPELSYRYENYFVTYIICK